MSNCHALKSIEAEITKLQIKQFGKDWTKHVRDTASRERVRAYLWERDDNWCDARRGTCACEPESDQTLSKDQTKLTQWDVMFPGAEKIKLSGER